MLSLLRLNGRFKTAVLLLFLPLLAFIQLVYTFPATTPLPDGTFIIHVYYHDLADIQLLDGFDVWEMNNLTEQYVTVAVDQADYAKIQRLGFKTAIPTDNQQTIHSQSPDTFSSGYRTVGELYADLAQLESSYATLTELVVYGQSNCKQAGGCTMPSSQVNQGFDLQALRISNEAVVGTSTVNGSTISRGAKPVFFLIAGIHAREITTPELAMRTAQWLLEGYGTNPDATWLVDHHEIWIVPTANPDGHWVVELGSELIGSPLFHRKNSNLNAACPTWPSQSNSHFGVDLNRNHSFEYGGASSSTFTCSPVYRGTGAGSEPETAALEALITTLIPDQRGTAVSDAAPENTTGIFISMHSFSELILWPWGYAGTAAPNRNGLRAIGDKMATYNGYRSCQPASCLYAASGTSDDFAYGTLGIPAFTFEVGTQFMPPYSEIDAIQWPDNGPALQYAAKIARAPYQLVMGPDVLDPQVALLTDRQLQLTAVINDANNGNQPINALSYTVDTPYWVNTAVTQTIPLDNLDAPIETISTTLDFSNSSTTSHTLFFRAQDNAGNWGPVTAVFVELGEEHVLDETVYLPMVTK